MAHEAWMALQRAECEAVHCVAAASPLFQDSVIGDDTLPAGGWIILCSQVLQTIRTKQSPEHVVLQQCQHISHTLYECRDIVFANIMLLTPEPTDYIDPRPTLTEAWFTTVNTLLALCHNDRRNVVLAPRLLRESTLVQDLFTDS